MTWLGARRPVAAEPRVEVRIGRVEVRRPPEPKAKQQPQPSPRTRRSSPRPEVRGFEDLAAARRYVDRIGG
jgi:hypothetical protein